MYRPIPLKEAAAVHAQNNADHDSWFRAKVQEALDDPRPGIPHKRVEAHFATRRAAALSKKQS